ncbi:MFS transporter [Kitasatospora sp. NPDC059648]|uniref:MFS transporter n=1 Tax=Kitasatospora sp. NPDC059648 TaxID=3346894 RepID=UPI00368462A5
MADALSAFASPAQGPLLGNLLPVRLIRRANTVDSATFSTMTMAGPALGGLLATWSTPAALDLDALTFLASLACVLRLTGQRDTARTEFAGLSLVELRDGWRYSVRHSWILWLTGLAMVLNVVCIVPFYTVLPLRLRDLGLPAGVYGLALAAQGLSAVLVSLALGRARRLPRAGLLAPAASLGVAGGVSLLAPQRAGRCRGRGVDAARTTLVP